MALGPVEITLAAIYALLVAATVTVAVLRRVRPAADLGELAARVRTWWVIVTVITLALLLGRTAVIGLFAFVSYLALKEYLSLIPTRRADRRVLFWAYLSIPVQYLWIGVSWYGMFIIFIPLYMFLFLPMRMVTVGETRGFLKAVGTLHWGLMITVFAVSHLAYLVTLPAAPGWPAAGRGVLLYLLILTEGNDVAQYLWGKALGRTRAAPTVSPGKTTAGLLGGLGTTTAVAVLLAPHLTPLSAAHAAMAGVIVSLGGFMGDLTISAVKRDVGVKDSGDTLPGHGGILDRLDSLTYAAPLFVHFLRFLYT
ncbi:MAG TPA: phosphatidate cytidylyltransferase [Acidobacteria bacterium]|nr:phosphatidate cytidylyltransferase [Acidobacteriota bacterium]